MDLPNKIAYKEGYKYQLFADTWMRDDRLLQLPDFRTEWFWKKGNLLFVRGGYAWDGPSGPTFDTQDSMRGSLFHDIIYQAIRMGLMDKKWRKLGDQFLYEICEIDGMNPIRNKAWYRAVRLFAAAAAEYGTEQEIQYAP